MNWNIRNCRPLMAGCTTFLMLVAYFLATGIATAKADVGRVHARDLSTTSDFDGDLTNNASNATHAPILFKRADGFLVDAADFDTFMLYVCNGRLFTDAMCMDEHYLSANMGLQQKEHNYVEQFIDSPEWTMLEHGEVFLVGEKYPELYALQGLRKLNGMRSDTNRETRVFDLTSDQWQYSRHVQNRPYGESAHPTFAYFEHIMKSEVHPRYNGGVIIIPGARSPHYQVAALGLTQPYPLISKWSDSAYLQDMANRGETAKRENYVIEPPTWFLLKDVYGPRDTLAVITRCLRYHGWTDPHMPLWQDRMTFPIGSACYDAILGTQNSAGLAWFLIEHKFKYDITTLASVTICSDPHVNVGSGDHPPVHMPDFNDELGATEMPNLLWWAGTLSSALTWRNGKNLMNMRGENSAYEAGQIPNILQKASWDTGRVGSMPSFPHKLTPHT